MYESIYEVIGCNLC